MFRPFKVAKVVDFGAKCQSKVCIRLPISLS